MKLNHSAIAGTLESSDAQVIVEPSDICGIELELNSSVMQQYGRQIKETVISTLNRMNVQNCRIAVKDQGALECTLKARVETAVFRAADKNADYPWEVLLNE